MAVSRKKYDQAFKVQAVKLSYERSNVRQVAEELGIRPAMLYRWSQEYEQYDQGSFPGNGKPKLTAEQEENMRLKKELAEAKMERDILKKALGIFSKPNGNSFNS